AHGYYPNRFVHHERRSPKRAGSPTAPREVTLLIQPPLVLIARLGDRFLHLPAVFIGQLHRPHVEGQLVDRTLEAEGHLIVLVVYGRAGVDPDIESLVTYPHKRDRVRLLV